MNVSTVFWNFVVHNVKCEMYFALKWSRVQHSINSKKNSEEHGNKTKQKQVVKNRLNRFLTETE